MNRDEVQYILRSYHLSGRDADDPQFQDALKMLKGDEELREWFSSEQAMDAKLSKAFRAFPVPPDLTRKLIAARKVVPQRAWWLQTPWLCAAAASLILLGILSLFLVGPAHKRPFTEFHSYIVQTAASLERLDIRTSDPVRIREWLHTHGAPDNIVIPDHLNGKARIGCRVFSWRGQRVSLVCFEIADNKVAHLFVMDRPLLTNLPGGVPQFESSPSGIATAAWSDSTRVSIVAMLHGADDLRQLLL